MANFAHKRRPPSLSRYRRRFMLQLFFEVAPFVVLSLGMMVAVMSANTQIVERWRDVLLVGSTGLITLTAAYIGGALEHHREREREYRQARRERVSVYRDYLMQVMLAVHRLELEAGSEDIGWLELRERVALTREWRLDMMATMPPLGDFSLIESIPCREAVDVAITRGLQYLSENINVRPTSLELKVHFRTALLELDNYETLI